VCFENITDKMLNPFCAKSRIVILGNHEDCIWSKSEQYAPVLWSDTMRLILSMVLEHHQTLKQGDSKNAIFQRILPPSKITIVKPPIGDPEATKMNAGSSSACCMGFGAVHSIGI
jgi:hypothetical protein